MRNSFQKTITACFVGYVVQAIVNTFVPLLFLTFQSSYGIPLEKITLLITINFFIQLLTDMAAAYLVDRVGYRISAVTAHFLAALGLILLAVLPEILPDPFVGLLIAVFFYAVGGGLIEVVISPIVESCPSERKDKTMSLLHSFYCWGSVGVISLSAIFFFVFGTEKWRILSVVWAIVPVINAVLFMRVPLQNIVPEGESGMSTGQLLKTGRFWLFFLVILCAGASEAAVSQWASAFAESTLGLSKALGDLVGPALFAVTMGISRLIYGKSGDRLDLNVAMTLSGALCVVSYLLVALSSVPALALFGMALSGFSVGLMWPGAYSSASASIKGGGNAMFALLALGGDFGCVGGPAVVGLLSGVFGGDMRTGILCSIVFPVVLTAIMFLYTKKHRDKKQR